MTGAAGFQESKGSCRICRKRIFTSRKSARKAGHQLRSEETGRPRPYPCPVVQGDWHIGHLAPSVISGDSERKQLYAPAEARARAAARALARGIDPRSRANGGAR